MIELDPVEQGAPPPKLRPATLVIDKQRKGPTGEAIVIFDSEHIAFYDVAEGSSLSKRIHKGRALAEREALAAAAPAGDEDGEIPF